MRHGVRVVQAGLMAAPVRAVHTTAAAAAAAQPLPLARAGHPIVYHPDMAINPIPDGHR